MTKKQKETIRAEYDGLGYNIAQKNTRKQQFDAIIAQAVKNGYSVPPEIQGYPLEIQIPYVIFATTFLIHFMMNIPFKVIDNILLELYRSDDRLLYLMQFVEEK